MQDNLKDILTNLNPDIDQETLMLYLQDKLQGEQKHAVEQQLADSDFESDAMDGLVALRDKREIRQIVELLNKDLKKKVEQKKQRRDKLRMKNFTWLYVSVIIVLLLIIISYVLIHRARTGS